MTEYADGYNEGKIVTWNVGCTMSLPHFGIITRRTPKQITVIELRDERNATDGYGHHGYATPTTVQNGVRHIARMTKRGTFCVDRHYTPLWDGTPQYFDYDD